MGKGAKLPTPEASPSPKSITMTQHRDSVLTTADQNVFAEMLNARRRHSFAKAQVAPTMLTQSALNSRFPSRGASPTEFRPKLQDNVTTLAGPLPTQSQLFPQRRRSSLAGNLNLMAGRAYELVPGFGKQGNLDGSHRRRKIHHLLHLLFIKRVSHHRNASIPPVDMALPLCKCVSAMQSLGGDHRHGRSPSEGTARSSTHRPCRRSWIG